MECCSPLLSLLREIDLGHHTLLLMSDQSIEVMSNETAPCDVIAVFNLDRCEAYHLMISLQEVFKEANA
jgi:hypothetical protein